jgi:hypothetical protein
MPPDDTDKSRPEPGEEARAPEVDLGVGGDDDDDNNKQEPTARDIKGKPVKVAEPKKPPTLSAQIDQFLTWSKPYRQIIALLVVLAGSFTTAWAWVVAHFATQTAVSVLECKLTHQLLAQEHGSRALSIEARIRSLRSLQKMLASQKGTNAAITQLMNEEAALQESRDSEEKLNKDEMNIAINCPK